MSLLLLSARNEEKTDRSAHHLVEALCNNEQLLVCHSFYYLRIRNKKTYQPTHHRSKVLCHYLYLRVMKKKLTGLRTTFLRLSAHKE